MSGNELADMRCEPCRKGAEPLERADIERLHHDVPEWALQDDDQRLERTFKHKDFREALAFVNRVGRLAEQEQHHPDIAIHWNKVTLTLWTHKIGGLHLNDFILAARIDRLGA